MSFLHPEWFWLMLLPLFVLYTGERRDAPALWMAAAMLFVCAALARPVLPERSVETRQRGSDVIVAVDLSASMQAADLAPTRLGAAKRLLGEMVRRDLQDRFGVIGFTTNAIVLSPLTSDAEVLLHLVSGLDESLIMTRGTSVSGALELAAKMSESPRPKVWLLSDGGDERDFSDAAAFARAHGLQVNVVMLATRSGAMLETREGGWLRDESGGLVVSTANEAVRSLSRATGGAFIEGADGDAVLRILEAQREADFDQVRREVSYRELFYFFVAAALLCFMVAVTSLHRMLSARLAAVLLLLGVTAEAGVLDVYHARVATEAYANGAYAAAARAYAEMEPTPEVLYNLGNAYYRAGEFEKALQAYRGVRSADAGFKAALFYNMGNSYVRLKQFRQAREAYRKSLALRFERRTLENLHHIAEAGEQDFMLSGRQQGEKRAEQSETHSGGPKPEEGGGSNMPVDAAAGGGGDSGKRARAEAQAGFSKHGAKLSSRQYELINQRGVRESKPW